MSDDWQPIETAPKDGTEIEIFCRVSWNKNKPFTGLYHWSEERSGIWENNIDNWLEATTPIYWRVPKLPEEK